MKSFNLKSYVVQVLRRASYRAPQRSECLRSARVSRGLYICKICGPDIQHKKKNVQVDHIMPIVPVTGWDGWENFIIRLFCDSSQMQVLCKPHHSEKTKSENEQRKKKI